MRILILNWRDIKHPLAGGAEVATHEHAKRWVTEGHTVTQFSSSIPGEKSEEVIDDIRIIRRGNHYTVHLYALLYYFRYLKGTIDLMVDEFHFIPFFTPLYFYGKKLAFIHETAEEIWFKNQPLPINVLGYLSEPFFFKLYKHVLFMTVSDSTKKDLMKFGIKEKNIFVIHNGINSLTVREKKTKNPTIIYLGRLAKDKGTEDAIRTFSFVVKYLANAKLWIVGREESPGYVEQLKTIAVGLGILSKVDFLGYVTEEEKFRLLKKAWILVHPSLREGWGLTVIEAARQGTPTVGYTISGLQNSVVNGETGILVKDRSPRVLSEEIIKLFKNKLLYNKLCKKAQNWSKNFSWDEAGRNSTSLIETII